MDTLLIVVIVLSAIACSAVSAAATRKLANPVFLISLGFFAPLVAALLRLSGLQATTWAGDTYVVLAESVGVWLLLPAVGLAGLALRRRPLQPIDRDGDVARALDHPALRWYARIAAVAHVSAVLLQNRISAGQWIVATDPELAYDLHTATVPGISILGRAGFAIAGLLFLVYWRRRQWIELVLIALLLLTPLTKLARIDIMMIGVTLAVLNAFVPVVKVNVRRSIMVVAMLFLAIYALVEVGNQRVSRYGRFKVSYADAIRFRTYAGPGETFAVLYGYFALSFENFDRFVRRNPEFRTNGLLSFSPVFNSFFFADRLSGGKYPDQDVIVERRNPVGAFATVGTALSNFYLDFGAALAWLPMLAFGGLWLTSFAYARGSAVGALIYATYSSAMVLSGFQAVVGAPFVYQDIFIAVLPFLVMGLVRPHRRASASEDAT